MKLYPFQRSGVKFLTQEKPVLYLADDMGLGKTFQAISAAKKLECKRVLVICPAMIRENWKREFEKVYKELKVNVHVKGKLSELPDNNVTILSYAFCQYPKRNFSPEVLLEQSLELLILDESHRLKNKDALQTQTILAGLAKRSARVWFLSGTPVTKCTTDLWSFLDLAKKDYLNFYAFAETYAKKKQFQVGRRTIKQYYSGKNTDKLKAELAPYMLRRKKQKVLKELPPRTFVNLHFDIKVKKKEYTEYLEDVQEYIKTGKWNNHISDQDIEHISTLRKNVAMQKVRVLKKLLEEEYFSSPLLVFGHHRDPLLELKESFKESAVIIGGQSSEERQCIVDRFQSGDIKFLFCSILAAGVGLTLTGSSICIFLEKSFNPSDNLQAQDRIYRIGQRRKVLVYSLIARNTFDERVEKILAEKQEVIKGVIEE